MKKSIKGIFYDWVQLIKSEEAYYLPKAMDLFYAMPYPHQKAFLEFISTEIPNKRWEDMVKDDTQYLDAIRSILIYYTGRQEFKQPSTHDFALLIRDYVASEGFREAEAHKGGVIVKKFTELLHEV